MSATIRRKPSGRYSVSLLVKKKVKELTKIESSVRINMILKDFTILSNRTTYKNPKFLRTLEKKLAEAQRILFRKTKGSPN